MLSDTEVSFHAEYILKILDIPKTGKYGLNANVWTYFILQSFCRHDQR